MNKTIFTPKDKSYPWVEFIDYSSDDCEVIYQGKHWRGTFLFTLQACITIAEKIGRPIYPRKEKK